ncbi:Rec8 like protein-domain-containing protein [Truncatella angustata]|uniref:Rec8 like protein-domain-containing protein n=1 Tax=Truncatella angustata TaxID=152316 RepID=A0A9P8UGU1_9PEZI|nr:Rec8 like protein-domain-containing protein [Truncatella angustata]KAH6651844.1 Rec8 like protein-domain-containing protein [Truncatella angustata]KAH8199006.1 hypothetical protein TruAng_006835 [Truncatella angustata]
MFYSHELLTNRQYGVATIWLVATIGKTSAKRVSKKAIQDVDVARACDQILEPGAPIALRLQGSLLYGLSKVYHQKWHYFVSDLTSVQEHMAKFMRQFGTNQLDPAVTRARPENLMIHDDPDFFPGAFDLPDLSQLLATTNQVVNQHSNKTSSQMSPHSLCSDRNSSGNEQFSLQLQLRESSVNGSHAPRHGLEGLSSAQKPAAMGGNDDIFGDDLEGSMDFGLQIDEFGNIMEAPEPRVAVVDEPDLPPLPTIESLEGARQPEQPQIDAQGGFFMMDEQPLPDAEALPGRRGEANPEAITAEEESAHAAPARRQYKRKVIHADEEMEIPRAVMRNWQTQYLTNCCTEKAQPVTTAQAQKNAIHLTFGLGIGNIGQSLGIPGIIHPLAQVFSGDSLFTAYTGLQVLDKASRKRTRSATESSKNNAEERRVRPRIEEKEGEQQGRGLETNDMFDFGAQQSPPEIGREALSALDDNPSSAMPWNNRGSSLMPGSSIQKGGSVRLGREQSSPLGRRGVVQDIVRYSSDADMGGMDFGDAAMHSGDSSFDGMPLPAGLPENEGPAQQTDTQAENQYSREALDREGKNFLGFIEQTLRENGERRHDEDFERQRKWIAFDDVFVPRDTNRATAAQAFYHVLTLVTKGQMVVEQDNVGKEPFGGIHVGLKLPPGA